MRHVYLVPLRKNFNKQKIIAALKRNSIKRYVFHSYGVKIWSKNSPKIGRNKLKVQDKTCHFDVRLLNYATLISRLNHTPHQAAAVITHYLFNQNGYNYKDELKFHKKRVKGITRFLPHVSSMKDHGWEINALKKAKML